MHTRFLLKNLKENLGLDDGMTWKWISVKQGRTQGSIHSAPVKNQLVSPVMNLDIKQMQGNSWLAESNCKLLYKNWVSDSDSSQLNTYYFTCTNN